METNGINDAIIVSKGPLTSSAVKVMPFSPGGWAGLACKGQDCSGLTLCRPPPSSPLPLPPPQTVMASININVQPITKRRYVQIFEQAELVVNVTEHIVSPAARAASATADRRGSRCVPLPPSSFSRHGPTPVSFAPLAQLVPKHELLSEDEKVELLKRYKLKAQQLPRMKVTDPVAKYYGLFRGQVCDSGDASREREKQGGGGGEKKRAKAEARLATRKRRTLLAAPSG